MIKFFFLRTFFKFIIPNTAFLKYIYTNFVELYGNYYVLERVFCVTPCHCLLWRVIMHGKIDNLRAGRSLPVHTS